MKIICRKTFVSLDEEDREALRRAAKICNDLYHNIDAEEDFWNEADFYQDLDCTEMDLLKIIDIVDRLYPSKNSSSSIEENVTW